MKAIDDREVIVDPSTIKRYQVGTKYFKFKSLLKGLQCTNVITKIGLVRVYHDIAVAEEDISKTSTTASYVLFKFVRMPLGLMNAHLKDFSAIHFMKCLLHWGADDLLIASQDIKSHQQHVGAGLKRPN